MMTIADLLVSKGRNVYSISPDATVFEAISEMAEREIGALLVMSGGSMVGIVSERDYARNVILKGKSSRDLAVREIMTTPVVSVSPRRTIDECMAVMTENRIRHLPVAVDDDIVGVVSMGDLVKVIIEDQKFEIEQLHHYLGS